MGPFAFCLIPTCLAGPQERRSGNARRRMIKIALGSSFEAAPRCCPVRSQILRARKSAVFDLGPEPIGIKELFALVLQAICCWPIGRE